VIWRTTTKRWSLTTRIQRCPPIPDIKLQFGARCRAIFRKRPQALQVRRASNPKSEARNPKQIQSTKNQKGTENRSIESIFRSWISDFFRIWDFVLRIWKCKSQ
jgi:hypothetical protein